MSDRPPRPPRLPPPLGACIASCSAGAVSHILWAPDLCLLPAASLQSSSKMFGGVVRTVEEIYVWSNRDPWLTVRRVACALLGVCAALSPVPPGLWYCMFSVAVLRLDGPAPDLSHQASKPYPHIC